MAKWTRDRLQYGGRPQLKSMQTQKLQGCAGFLVADMQQNLQKKCLANIIRPSTSKPLILAKPETAIRAPHHPGKTSVKTSLEQFELR